jgi:1-acyl-sn-glycerol-3-phosphate acyltransferase
MGLTFSIKGTEKIAAGQSYIITPNHQSFADIIAIITTFPIRFRWVVKRELLKIPFFGWALARTGAIAVDRTNRSQSVERLNQGLSLIEEGWSVLIYPEGTRTYDGKIQPFKKGAFMMALQAGVPILPVTCNGAYQVMPRSTLMFRPGHVTVTIGDSISTESLTAENVAEVMEKTRTEMIKNLDPEYNPFSSNGRPC